MLRWTGSFVWIALVLAACGDGPAPRPLPPPPPRVVAPPTPPPLTPKMPEPADWTLPAGASPALLDPSLANEPAPETYKVKFQTTEGDFVVQVDRSLAPNGAARFYNLVKAGF